MFLSVEQSSILRQLCVKQVLLEVVDLHVFSCLSLLLFIRAHFQTTHHATDVRTDGQTDGG